MIDELEIELQETTDELEVEDVNNISYNELTNKPKINNVELVGNKTSDDLGLVDEATLDDYYTKTQTDSAISNHHDSTKQNTLVSGTNIKTINNQSVLGSGNIDIQGGGSSDYSTLTNKPKINNVTLNGNKSLSDLGINIPTKTSDLTNDGDGTNPFLTQHQSLENYSTTSQMNTAISTATNDMATQTWVEGKGYLTEHQSLSAYRTSANQDLIDATKEDSSNKVTSLSSSSTDTQYPSAKCVYDELDSKQDNLPSVVNDRYLHTNSSTGALEWSSVSGGIEVLTGTSNPTTSTVGQLGQIYVNTSASSNKGRWFRCIKVDGSTYTWEAMGQGVYESNICFGNNAAVGGALNIAIGNDTRAVGSRESIAIGASSCYSESNGSVCVGSGSRVYSNSSNGIAIGYYARVNSNCQNAIQLGRGINNETRTLYVGDATYNRKLLDINSGLIPQERINLIKTTMDSVATVQTQYYLGEQTSVSITMPTSASVGQEILVTFSSGSTACTLTCDLQGFSFVPKANKTSWIKFTCCDATNWLVETKEG